MPENGEPTRADYPPEPSDEGKARAEAWVDVMTAAGSASDSLIGVFVALGDGEKHGLHESRRIFAVNAVELDKVLRGYAEKWAYTDDPVTPVPTPESETDDA